MAAHVLVAIDVFASWVMRETRVREVNYYIIHFVNVNGVL